MSKRRVVVTGLGLISPVGQTVEEGWSNILAGKSGIQPITHFEIEPFSVRFGGPIYGFDLEKRENERITIDPLIYSTVIGGSSGVYVNDIAKDDKNCTYLYGYTNSPEHPNTNDSYSPGFPGMLTFVMKMNSSGKNIDFATLIGGYSVDWPDKIKLDGDGAIFLLGRSCSNNFPTLL